MRRLWLPMACIAAAGVIGVTALVDHRNKGLRGNHAQLLEWYCRHEGTRCGGPSSDAIEEHWEVRERVYEVAFGALLAVGIGGALFRIRRR